MLSPENMQPFTAVVEEWVCTAPAQRLNTTQSGTSQEVAKLKRHLDVPLLVFGGQRAPLTAIGRQFYLRSIAILRELGPGWTARPGGLATGSMSPIVGREGGSDTKQAARRGVEDWRAVVML
ncbi:MAG: LysR family transcriptional regulator [Acetobacteraceae bacterium]|nr:LysR family transcriptional regulator [Acetobacteraceae bacterium]